MRRQLAITLIALLAGGAATAQDGFKREGTPAQRHDVDALEGKAPPALELSGWVNSKGVTLEGLHGKVVVLAFVGVWGEPSRAAMRELEAVHGRLAGQGLVILGVHSTLGGGKMAEFVKAGKISWPVAVDVARKTQTAYRVDSYPDYYLIDRSGTLRVADLENADLERAVKVLLSEPAPRVPPEPKNG